MLLLAAVKQRKRKKRDAHLRVPCYCWPQLKGVGFFYRGGGMGWKEGGKGGEREEERRNTT